MKTSWRFKGEVNERKVFDEQAKIIVELEENGETWTAVYEKVSDEPVRLGRHDWESGEDLYFYAKTNDSAYLDDEIREDLAEHYGEIKEQLDLYEHYPTYDDSRAGQLFCTGETLEKLDEWLVLMRGFAYDI